MPSSPNSPLRRAVLIDEDFELFHLVLFYEHTKRICFVHSTEPFICGDIQTTDAEGVYRIAKKRSIPSLQRKALHFLEATCNVENITSRTFSPFAAEHREIGFLYDAYFIQHWEEVKKSSSFKDFWQTLEAERDDLKEYSRVNKKFREMVFEKARF